MKDVETKEKILFLHLKKCKEYDNLPDKKIYFSPFSGENLFLLLFPLF